MKLLGHRALFGKGMRLDTIAGQLEPYAREEVVLVLTSLSALLSHCEAEERDAQRALVHAFFLESAAKVEPQIKSGCVVFHRAQVLALLRMSLIHCAGDRASQPVGPAFFEGVARALAAVTDHLKPPRPPKVKGGADTREQLLTHFNHLIRCEPPLALDIEADVVRAHHLVFERGPKVTARQGLANLPGAFHERHGVRCERWFAITAHLLAKARDYTLTTMHSHQPAVRITSDFRHGALETRQVERLCAPLSTGLRRAGEAADVSLAEGRLDDLDALRRRPVLHLLEDTYVAVDPHLLAEAITADLGGRLVACAQDRSAARRAWTAIVRDHVQALLPPLTAPLRKADLKLGRSTVDWWHVKGSDALLVWVVAASLRRDFPDDEALASHNGRVVSGVITGVREARAITAALRAGDVALDGKRYGQIKRVLPVIVLERDVPQDATAHRLLAKLIKEEGLADEAKVQAPTLIGMDALEGLAQLDKPPNLTALVAKRLGGPARNKPFSDSLVKQGLPARPDSVESIPSFEKLIKSLRKSLGV